MGPLARLPSLTDERFAASLSGDNRGGRYLGEQRYTANVAVNGLLHAGESTQLQFQTTSPTRLVRFWSIDHFERLTPSGLSLRGSFSRYDSEPDLGAGFAAFNLETSSKTGRLELAYPVIRSHRTNLSTRMTFSYHDGRTDSNLLGFSEDRLGTLRLGLTWDRTDALRGINTLDFEVSRGLSAFGASDEGAPNLSRLGGNPTATKATLYAARLQDLRAGFSLLLAASGQYAGNNLLASEEFAFGGEYFGRAFDAAEIVGDSGA